VAEIAGTGKEKCAYSCPKHNNVRVLNCTVCSAQNTVTICWLLDFHVLTDIQTG